MEPGPTGLLRQCCRFWPLITCCARSQTSATAELNSSAFWVTTRRNVKLQDDQKVSVHPPHGYSTEVRCTETFWTPCTLRRVITQKTHEFNMSVSSPSLIIWFGFLWFLLIFENGVVATWASFPGCPWHVEKIADPPTRYSRESNAGPLHQCEAGLLWRRLKGPVKESEHAFRIDSVREVLVTSLC